MPVIESFRHRGLHDLFARGVPRGVPPGLVKPVAACLSALHAAEAVEDLDVPGWWLHRSPRAPARWSLAAGPLWRITFGWGEHGPALVDLEHHP